MIKVIGNWDGWDTPMIEYGWWIHPLREWGIAEFYMSPISGIRKKGVIECQTTDEVLSLPELEEYTRVFVDEKSDTLLEDFVHPENALYVFGKVGYSPLHLKRENDKSIIIPSVRNGGGFWSHQTMCMVLYDRFIKEQSK